LRATYARRSPGGETVTPHRLRLQATYARRSPASGLLQRDLNSISFMSHVIVAGERRRKIKVRVSGPN
jgi:hypothetical protein